MASNFPSWLETFNMLKMHHDLSYLKIDEALSQEERNINSVFGRLPVLHAAAAYNLCKRVHSLIETGINIESLSEDGCTPLHIAASHGHLSMVALLLTLKANVNARNNKKSIPLQEALYRQHFGVCALLIKGGADVDAKNNKAETPLLYLSTLGAAAKGDDGMSCLDLVNCLIEHGANIDAVNTSNCTPLHNAAISGNCELAKILIDKGANIVAKLLLERGANVNVADVENLTPLHLAASSAGCEEITTMAIKLGADLRVTENKCQMTPLHIAIKHGNFNIVKILVSSGAEVNNKMMDGSTALHAAAQNGNVDIVKYLLENGSYFDMKTGCIMNVYASQLAQKFNNRAIVALLKNANDFFNAIKKRNVASVKNCLKNGVPVNCRSLKFKSALIYACWKGYSDIVDVLIAKGANINIVDDDNLSALHYAAKFSHVAIVNTLLKRGAVFNIASDKMKKTPLDYAIDGKNTDIINLLKLIHRVFENVQNEKSEVIQELTEMKMKNSLEFFIISSVHNNDKKTLLEVSFASKSKEIAHSLLHLLQ